ncbi:MAG TPA: TIM barrel protein [Rhizobiaceae bacterium]|nr:TIM barrel protein [Rhizobiaceae bacterium]
MSFKLSLNTNPLVNRFAEADDLIETIARDIRIRNVQLTHEFINPGWPAAVIAKHVRAFNRALSRTGVVVTSGMTGPYGRLNHFGHPDADVRAYYVDWFRTFADISADIGASSVGTQFAIFTQRDYDDPVRREALIDIAIECWGKVAEHAREAGLTFLFWEPMSVGREVGHTLQACRDLQARIDAAGLALPMKMMVDIDHGDVTSPNPADYDPFAWAEAFPPVSPIIHIKQSSMKKSGHAPFTAANNENGRITPATLLPAIRRGGGVDNEICLELSFREREPTDSRVVAELAESVAFWAGDVDTGAGELNV